MAELQSICSANKRLDLNATLYFTRITEEDAAKTQSEFPALMIKRGRPNWTNVFEEADDQHYRSQPGSIVGVFFCGGPALGSAIRAAAYAATLASFFHCEDEDRMTAFNFQKENF